MRKGSFCSYRRCLLCQLVSTVYFCALILRLVSGEFLTPLSYSPVFQTNLRQSNRISSSDSVYGGTSTRSRDGGHWDSSSHGSSEERQELNKELERKMQEELSALKQQGEDVDRLVMKALMARVRDSEPNIAFKALASIEVHT